MSNPFLTRAKKAANGQSTAYKRAPKQEREAAERIGGRLTPASGAKFKKGDVIVPELARIECKCTGNKSFSVTREMLDKIETAGLLNDEIPYIEIEFINNATARSEGKVAVLRQSALETLLRRLQEAEQSGPTDDGRVRRAKRHHNRLSPYSK